MLIAIIGGRCTGKTALAEAICQKVHAQVFSGRDYTRLAPTETEAETRFRALLAAAVTGEEIVIYIIPQRELLELLPPGALRVRCRAELWTVKSRFAARMQDGRLPASVAAMLEKQHGIFDDLPCDLVVDTARRAPALLAAEVLALGLERQRAL